MKQMICCLALAAALAGIVTAEPPKAVSPGETIDDWRLKPLKDLNGYFPFEPSNSKAEWNARAKLIRRRILVANGLWPMPTKTPLKAVVHGKIEFDTYTVEKVYFQSMPGLYVTGNLYRPKNAPGKCPAVLCPHGHFTDGRFGASSIKDVRTQITQGAERFEDGGRNSIQARCVGLARLGCVVFNYDMIGYCDSAPISYELAHRFAKQRADMNSTTEWGLFSPRAESHAQSVMGLQTYNSIRALDWIETLRDVDSSRLAVTGASGGGTQTFLLCAVDPRPAVAVPAVMVSTAMQGGCTCENCSLLRVGSGNVELAALFAPKPQAMTAADDWTREMMTKGYPQLQELYGLLSVPDAVYCRPLLEFPHNYNYVSRETMYQWFNTHLELGLTDFEETDFPPLTEEEAAVWNDQHPQPAGGADHERAVIEFLTSDADRQLQKLKPQDASSLERFRESIGGAYAAIIGRTLDRESAAAIAFDRTKVTKDDKGSYWLFSDLLKRTDNGEELPLVSLHPKTVEWNGTVVIWLTDSGKAGLFDANGVPISEVSELLSAGTAVIAADLIGQGEHVPMAAIDGQQRKVENPREAPAYTYCYNDTLLAQRTHDVLSLIAFVTADEHAPKHLHVVATGESALAAALARGLSADLVNQANLDLRGFRFSELRDYRDSRFLPGAIKYGDVPAILALNAPHPLVIGGESQLPKFTQAAYRAAQSEQALQLDGPGRIQALERDDE